MGLWVGEGELGLWVGEGNVGLWVYGSVRVMWEAYGGELGR